MKQFGSVIDVAEKTIEFRNLQNAHVPLEVVAGHLTMDLKPKCASALQKQLTPQAWEQARQGQEATILRPSSENIGLDSSSITHPVAMTTTPPRDSDHHQTDTSHGQMYLSSFHFPQVCRTTWHTELIGDLVLVTCCPFGGGNFSRSMHWHAECFMSVMLRSWQSRFW